uniref:Uncharacterized protein n=1 Tax=Thuricola similis TaxID=2784598 RepID=A0A7T8G531_9CILI|nr:hypothetical protein K4Z05_mgp01 [Thuricola similis]QQP22162.1 hypothetical protein TSIM_56 [Thuricola similis]
MLTIIITKTFIIMYNFNLTNNVQYYLKKLITYSTKNTLIYVIM